MPNNFVLAFGGTGARCLEALTYLYASGTLRESAHLLLIDPDAANGNVGWAQRQLTAYSQIHRELKPDRDSAPLFSVPLNGGYSADTFLWAYPNRTLRFEDQINYAAHPSAEREFLDLLYDSDDLEMSFTKGYVGRAHIGSLDLYRALRTSLQQASEEIESERTVHGSDRESIPVSHQGAQTTDGLKAFVRELQLAVQTQKGANVLVIGSIFGGTGASGIPSIPPLLREVVQAEPGKLRIGSVQLASYFIFDRSDARGAPDSGVHPLATQSAIYHYGSSDTGYHRIYLYGAPERVRTSERHCDGGANQRNSPHYLELAGALAALDFFEQEVNPDQPVSLAVGGAEIMDWDHFPGTDRAPVRKKLARLATFALFHTRYIHPALKQDLFRNAAWTHRLAQRVGGSLVESGALAKLDEFLKRFLIWVVAIRDTSGEPADGVLFSRWSDQAEDALAQVMPGANGREDAYHHLYVELGRERPSSQETPVGWYLHAATHSVDRFCERTYSWWRNG